MGLQTEFKLNNKISFGGEAFLGRTVRNTDSFQPKAESIPVHFFFKFGPSSDHSFKFHYAFRDFEQQPSLSLIGADYVGSFMFKSLDFNIKAEAWRLISTASSNQQITGQAFLISPKVSYKSAYINPVLSYENWKNDLN